jgi:glycosyltransferase involved in cell wall biosynthesis
MKVLISAYACEPDKGSEPAVGWNWARQAAQHHDVWVITRENNRASIERAMEDFPLPNLHFEFVDLPSSILKLKRQPGGLHLYYLLWQRLALSRAESLHRAVRFDIGHHVTFVSSRLPTFLPALGLPFIWGPIGGFDATPRCFYTGYGRSIRLRELGRETTQRILPLTPWFKKTAREAAVVLAATPVDRDIVGSLRRGPTFVRSAIGLAPSEVLSSPIEKSTSEDLHLLFAGNLLQLKGVHLLLEAMALAKREGANLHLRIAGSGPFQQTLNEIVNREGLQASVTFLGQLPRHELASLYRAADLFVFPSLHDSGGFAVLEAMGQGLPVLCLDVGGPSHTVARDCGIRIPAHNPEQVVRDLKSALLHLAHNRHLLPIMGNAALQHAARQFVWEKLAKDLDHYYELALSQPRRSHNWASH